MAGKKSKKSKGSPEVACALPRPTTESRGVTVREISNGFVVEKYSSGPKGYKSTETFSKTKPKLDIVEKKS